MNAVVAERGQVTIPQSLRKRLGIVPHTVVDFEEDGGRLILTKVMDCDPVSKVMGCLNLGRPTDAVMRDLRGDA